MNHDELALTKQAILNEIEGYEFYKLAASRANSAETKEALLEIAQEEMKHIEWLKTLFNSLKDGSDAFDLAMVSDAPSPGIYSWKKSGCGELSLAVSVFGVAMQMEADAVKFYTDARDKSSDSKTRKLFDTLIGWEKNHYELFANEYSVVQQEWWSEQGFAPF